ncbi:MULTISPECIES: PDDEXK family nuclease [Burkholderia cepacia complex]|uniref:hypothetical protein n=1 Tax=Burkholderia cepacia complex TaxID=87882 RepID=UPI000AB38B1A|nr:MULTISPECIES: hypothetical protein [Burkholderia cepacia complex]MCA8449992.1 hypothetical protein [Burkholderia vietnamiensis]HDR8952280.1 hypothetical protein [Burkholderia vietnamiensis]
MSTPISSSASVAHSVTSGYLTISALEAKRAWPPIASKRSPVHEGATTGEFKLLNLARPFVTPRDVRLPPTDRYGWPHGVAYEALLKARQPSLSTRSTFRGMKFRRRYEALSGNEQRILFSLAFHPYVIDVRDQYGIYDVAALQRVQSKGELLLRTDLMTIDVVVTYVMPGSLDLHYHGISIKPADYVPDPKDLDRESREQSALAPRSWTWELMRGDAVSSREFANNFGMYRTVRDRDVALNYDHAQWFAKKLLRSSTRGTMGSVLGRISRRLGISDDAAHQLFAVAVSYGFLTVDHSKDLRMDLQLHLLR